MTWYMRRSGASFAIDANGTAMTAAGRAVSSGFDTVMLTPAASAPPAPNSNAAAAAPPGLRVIFSPYGMSKDGSTTSQNADLGSPAVSNSSGRLVRVTGQLLSQV